MAIDPSQNAKFLGRIACLLCDCSNRQHVIPILVGFCTFIMDLIVDLSISVTGCAGSAWSYGRITRYDPAYRRRLFVTRGLLRTGEGEEMGSESIFCTLGADPVYIRATIFPAGVKKRGQSPFSEKGK